MRDLDEFLTAEGFPRWIGTLLAELAALGVVGLFLFAVASGWFQ